MTPQPSFTHARSSRRAGQRISSLFDEHGTMVFGLCRLLLRDHHEAEDASQQTFVSAYRALLRGTEPRDAGPWLAAIARNECRARLRSRMRAAVPLSENFDIPDGTDLAEDLDRRAEFDALTVEIAKLPTRQREAIAMRDFLGLSYEEVAAALSVSVPVVESLLFRARRRLRDSVRTVPRYAAGVVVVPLALRAAIARDVPDFEGGALGTGLTAGALGTAIAKLVSLPFTMKAAATTAAIVAAGTVVAPHLIGEPVGQPAAAPGLAVALSPSADGTGAPTANGEGSAAAATPATQAEASGAGEGDGSRDLASVGAATGDFHGGEVVLDTDGGRSTAGAGDASASPAAAVQFCPAVGIAGETAGHGPAQGCSESADTLDPATTTEPGYVTPELPGYVEGDPGAPSDDGLHEPGVVIDVLVPGDTEPDGGSVGPVDPGESTAVPPAPTGPRIP